METQTISILLWGTFGGLVGITILKVAEWIKILIHLIKIKTQVQEEIRKKFGFTPDPRKMEFDIEPLKRHRGFKVQFRVPYKEHTIFVDGASDSKDGYPISILGISLEG